jgi:hypothetical protein
VVRVLVVMVVVIVVVVGHGAIVRQRSSGRRCNVSVARPAWLATRIRRTGQVTLQPWLATA